jgi:hypothetical protein
MRKLFWGCTACSVVLAGGVISTAHFALHHPESVVGRVLNGASYAAAFVNPVSGLGPVVEQARAAEEGDGGECGAEAVPGEPVPVAEEPTGEDLVGKPAEPGPIVVANSGGAPIVINEEERPAGSAHLPMPETVSPVQHTGPFNPASECPPCASAAPTVMPYCEGEEEACEMLPMPAREAETLPMPRKVEEEEEGEQPDACSEQECIGELFRRCVEEQLGKPRTDAAPALDSPPTGCPPLHPCQPPGKQRGSTAPGSEGPSEASGRAVRRKLSIFTNPSSDEGCPRHPEVDTMEFRPSDRCLYDYGPGPL